MKTIEMTQKEIQEELERLQKKYEKKMKSFGPMVPLPIQKSALDGIVKQMDKLEKMLENKGD